MKNSSSPMDGYMSVLLADPLEIYQICIHLYLFGTAISISSYIYYGVPPNVYHVLSLFIIVASES